MKRVYSKNAVLGLLLAFSFVFFGAGKLAAQAQATTLVSVSNGTALYAQPVGNFVVSGQADSKLLLEMEQLVAQMKANPGSPFFDALQRKFNYFSAIRNEVATGKSVKEAIVSGLEGAALPLPRPTQIALQQLKQEAVNLLKV
ncbi:MAG: hypothetical protein H6577_16390 [Lewinellaceae bacterium]|nr:hypothetical protein [Saprospiraceae bacterium]MCB9339703.1 hypothetical protein [Lewinellaceae bacterium]